MKVTLYNIYLSEQLFIKNPMSSELGTKILAEGLNLLHEVGLEDFTFRKLALKIASTESTIYRYFENKNQFLFYLVNYYWSWIEIQLTFSIANVTDPNEKLKKAIKILTQKMEDDANTPFIDESKLQEVIMVESSKTFLSKKVDEENKLGYFSQYKKLVDVVAKIIKENNPNYNFPHALVSTVIESVFHQRFFNTHLPKLSNNFSNEDIMFSFYYNLCAKTISE